MTDAGAPSPKRSLGRPFPKGVSPNPGGKPKSGVRVRPVVSVSITELDAMFLKAIPAAMELLLTVIEDTNEETRDRVRAAICILDKVKANAAPVPVEAAPGAKEQALEEFVEAMKAKPPRGDAQ